MEQLNHRKQELEKQHTNNQICILQMKDEIAHILQDTRNIVKQRRALAKNMPPHDYVSAPGDDVPAAEEDEDESKGDLRF